MVFIVGFLVLVAIIGGLLYLLVIVPEVPGVVQQRFGTLEALPSDIGQWSVDSESEEGRAAEQRGLRREVRLFHDMQREKLLRQTRYRNPATNVIVRVDPDAPVPRRRVRSHRLH
jgi:hypothetical protein